MVWPSALTTDSDITTKFTFEQGITRILESGNDFSAVHQAVAKEIRNWLESKGGVPDADKITNSSDYQDAAAQLFASRILQNRMPELSQVYFNTYIRLRSEVTPRLSSEFATGGSVGKVVLIKQGQIYYTDKRAASVFGNKRRSP